MEIIGVYKESISRVVEIILFSRENRNALRGPIRHFIVLTKVIHDWNSFQKVKRVPFSCVLQNGRGYTGLRDIPSK